MRSKEINKKICRAVSEAMHVNVKQAVKIQHGEVNHVYKIVTDKQNLLARVFRYAAWPEDGKLRWIEKQLIKHKIPHAKILYYSRSPKFFSHGFMVSEFLEGNNGREAVTKRQLSLASAFYQTGKMLKQIHQIKLKGFGKIPLSKNASKNFVDYKIKVALSRIKSLESRKAIKPGLSLQIEDSLKKLWDSYKNVFQPVLVHSDPNRENAIWTAKKHQWVFVDWDNAFSGSWLEDYCDLTYWVGWDRKPSHAKRVHALISKNFFCGYGPSGFNTEQLESIERGMHIFKATGMLAYYFLFKKSASEFNKSKRLLFKLLK